MGSNAANSVTVAGCCRNLSKTVRRFSSAKAESTAFT
jgi:hypothetical protein